MYPSCVPYVCGTLQLMAEQSYCFSTPFMAYRPHLERLVITIPAARDQRGD